MNSQLTVAENVPIESNHGSIRTELSSAKQGSAIRIAAASLLLLASSHGSETREQYQLFSGISVPPAIIEGPSLQFDSDPDILQLSPPLPNPRGNEKITPKGITLHWFGFDADGKVEGLTQALRNNPACGGSGCSVQYAVMETGDIYQMMESPLEMAFHARSANPTTIGIEIEGDPTDFETEGDSFNEQKFEAVVSLTAELIESFNIPIEGEVICNDVRGIHGHSEYNGCMDPQGTKSDVGQAYTQAVIDAVYEIQ